jgi:GH24 family phage-related lysozyme (muramidase)
LCNTYAQSKKNTNTIKYKKERRETVNAKILLGDQELKDVKATALLVELLKADPEDAPILKALASERDNGSLVSVLFNRAAACMDPEIFIQALKKGDVASVVSTCERVLEIRILASKVNRELF